MSTTLMTCDEQVANIQRLGHAQAKAEFLALVALRGGYFASRQFDVGIGVERGERSEDFLADLLDRGHCRRHVFAHNRQVFHLRFAHPSAEVLVFCCVDSGSETSGPFANHLLRYLPLFPELPFFKLVYVATVPTRLGKAQTVFERVLSRGRKWLTKVANPDRLLAQFRDRKLFEKRETSSFGQLRLDRLRDDMQCFSGRRFALMFARWETSGDEAIRPEIAAQKMPNGRFFSVVFASRLRPVWTHRGDVMNSWISLDLVNAAKKAGSPQFRWRRSPKTPFGPAPTGPSAPRRGGWTPVSGSGEGRERPRFRSAAPPRTLPSSLPRRPGSLPPLP